MISIKKLRKNKESFQERLALKQDNSDIGLILSLDEKLRELKTISSEMRAERNSASEAIGQAKKSGDDTSVAINTMKELGENLKKVEEIIQQEISEFEIPGEVEVTETKKAEIIDIERQIDKFKRKENPDFKGAFHEKKKRFDTPKAGKNQRQGKSKPKNQRGRRR